MKKLIGIIVAVVLVLSLSSVVMADGNSQKGKSENAANDQPGAGLYLYEKNPSGNWPIVEGGAWGKVQFTGASFVFNGHGLEAGVEYCLIVYEGWPNVDLLGCGTANGGGNVNIAGDADIEGSYDGMAIWLVPCEDLNAAMDTFIDWDPGRYLFEHDMVGAVS